VNGKDTIFSTTGIKGIARPCHEKATGRQNVNNIKNEFKMKKLNKLSINLNKVIKNEELVNLRGGYGSYSEPNTYCYCASSLGGEHIISQSFDAGCGCNNAILDRWIQSNCWPEHWGYSNCHCNPCV
jgi:hypothetical protein